MAVQMMALLARVAARAQAETCVCCGSAWKAHPAMYETFAREMREGAPGVTVVKPVFEHVMAGVVRQRIDVMGDPSPGELARVLTARFADFRITW